MFLERQQRIFCDEFLELFLLHLDFRGIKKEYNLDYNSFSINMNSPSHYHEAMEQSFREMEFANYNALKDDTNFSKTFLIKRYLAWSEKDFEDNKKGFDEDKRYFPEPPAEPGMEGMGGSNDTGGSFNSPMLNNEPENPVDERLDEPEI
jgi:hypothetical protein